jgi:hypothetical protein
MFESMMSELEGADLAAQEEEAVQAAFGEA